MEIPETKPGRRMARNEKSKGAEDADALIIFTGTLRELSEESLLLDTSEYGVVRFRVEEATEFLDEAGDPLGESPLKPGDRIRLEAGLEDLETVLSATLVRRGTPEEREAASSKVDAEKIRAPGSLGIEAPKKAETADGRPVIRRGRPEAYRNPSPDGLTREEAALLADPGEDQAEADPMIAAAREAPAHPADPIPSFIVRQFTTSYQSSGNPPQWKTADAVTADLVVSEEGSEEYRNLRINGKGAESASHDPGAWSAEELARIPSELLAPQTAARFTRRGEETLSGRAAVVFDFGVGQSRSPWKLDANGESVTPAYLGSVWIDRATHRVLRIEKRAAGIAAQSPFSKAERILEYGFVRLNQRLVLLPTHGESVICGRHTAACTREVTDFRNYRKLDADAGHSTAQRE